MSCALLEIVTLWNAKIRLSIEMHNANVFIVLGLLFFAVAAVLDAFLT